MGNQQNGNKTTPKSRKRKKRLGISTDGPKFEFSDLAAPDVYGFIKACLELNVYVAFYTSRDGGAVCVSVMHDDFETTKVWLKDQDELFALMEAIQDALAGNG